MGLFTRKTKADKTKANRELIEKNSLMVDALVVLAKQTTETVGALTELREKLKYLIPSDNPKIVDFDQKIKNALDDLRIVLIKTDGAYSDKAVDLITDINVLISERNTIV